MKAREIVPGFEYETKLGEGKCVYGHEGRFEFNITRPFPRGRSYLKASQVIRRIVQPEATVVALRSLLQEALDAIDEELAAAGPDEVAQHPTYQAKAALCARIRKTLSRRDAP